MEFRQKALDRAKGDKDYSTRRSMAKHELKRMVRNLPGFLKRKKGYKEHLHSHLLTESDPRKWAKYNQ